MCCYDQRDPPHVNRAKCVVIIQCVIDIVLAFVSVFTFEDGGFLGIAASAVALTGVVSVLSSGCGLLSRPASWLLLTAGNVLSSLISVAQVVYLIERLATVEAWCCTLNNTVDGMRALLIVLVLAFFGGAVVRLFVGAGPARRARKGPFDRHVLPAVQLGVPVASALVAQGVPVP